ncbi:MAG: acyl dehydratase [Nitrospinota bacterium]|nr:MAG: acyl dehydratase [Nitrospinota bacterium]
MQGKFFEDFTVGEKISTLSRTVTETDIVNFVCLVGITEELFTSIEYIRNRSLFKDRIAPGTLIFALAEGLTMQTGILHDTGLAFLGLKDLRIPAPVYKDDTIRVEIEVVEKRETRKPDRGVVTFVHRVQNQRGEVVMEYTITRMMRRRGEEQGKD